MPRDGGPLSDLTFQRRPPANVEAERALLGALLANNKAYARVAAFLAPEHFADPEHGRIYQAITRRVEAQQLADAVTLQGEFDPALLAELLGATVGIINAGEYGRAIHDAWARRQVIEIGEKLVNDAFAAEGGLALAEQGADALIRLTAANAGDGPVTLSQALADAVQRADAAHRGERGHRGIDTGVPSFDSLWCGLWPGELYYLCARSRTGKTPAMLQIARNVAGVLADGEHVHIVSLEMTASALGVVNLAAVTGWSADQIRSGEIGGADAWLELERARGDLARLPIVIDDEPGLNLGQIGARARAVQRTRRTRLLLIDYLELIGRGKDETKTPLVEFIPTIGNRLKALAKALSVPIVVLRQINKSRDAAESTRPTLTDLRYDGGEAADATFCLWREELGLSAEPPDSLLGKTAEKAAAARDGWRAKLAAAKGRAEFGALRRRFGPLGWRTMRFDGPRMVFTELVPADEPPDLWEQG